MAVYIQQTESESVQKSTSNPPSTLNTCWEFFIFIIIFFFPKWPCKVKFQTALLFNNNNNKGYYYYYLLI